MNEPEPLWCDNLDPHEPHVHQQGYKQFACPGKMRPKRHVTVTWYDEHGGEVGHSHMEFPRAAAFMSVAVRFEETVVKKAKLP